MRDRKPGAEVQGWFEFYPSFARLVEQKKSAIFFCADLLLLATPLHYDSSHRKAGFRYVFLGIENILGVRTRAHYQ